jgi:hypothetical protein
MTNSIAQNTINLAYNVNLTITSANKNLLAYLGQGGQKINPKSLTLKHSKSTDTTLASALSSGTYDSTFTGIIQKDLTAYSQALKTAYNSSPGPKGKQLLTTEYNGAQLLLKEAGAGQ